MVKLTRTTSTTSRTTASILQQQLYHGSLLGFAGWLIVAFLASSSLDASTTTTTSAFPTGAGSCDPGASVRGFHLSRTVTTGSIDDYFGPSAVCTAAGADAFSNCVSSSGNNDASVFIIGKDTTVTVTGDSGQSFKGFLIKLTGTTVTDGAEIDTTDFVTVPAESLTSGDASIADQCTTISVGGVTHTSNSIKTSATAIINVPEQGNFILTVTIVVANDDTAGSVYYYTEYPFSTIIGDTPDGGGLKCGKKNVFCEKKKDCCKGFSCQGKKKKRCVKKRRASGEKGL